MNYVFMHFSCPKLNLDEILQVASDVGYAGIEPRSGSSRLPCATG